ncbi:FAD/NAD(P)-binding protein [Agrobacterium vitis]|uniref:Adhesin n=1 Tax=Agrobacterium vitis TaxID=373 RepID=A0A7K1RNG0_AGRVI|nr:FAD/NAD(P)-binding protein [Agrobacterium vitis]MVA59578.1 adhesin [Agrobacterium vitis]
MVKTPIRIGIVGLGPRGLSVFERIISVAACGSSQELHLHIFDGRTPASGAHSPMLPDYLLLNTVASQLGVFPDNSCFGSIPGAMGIDGPNFLSWCHLNDIRINTRTGSIAKEGRSVEAGDFLPRRLLGSYLSDAFRHLMSSVPDNMTVQFHETYVNSVHFFDIGGNSQTPTYLLRTTADEAYEVDRLVLALGHTGNENGEGIDAYDGLIKTVDGLSPSNTLLVEGMGLTAMDVTAALTVGRGGWFERLESGKHFYHPSGQEPTILMRSRDGIPFRTRPNGLEHYTKHKAVVLTSARISHLRGQSSDKSLDFVCQILPLLQLEMRSAAVAIRGAMQEGADFRATILEQLANIGHDLILGVDQCLVLLQRFEEKYGYTDVNKILFPEIPADVNSSNYQAWLCEAIIDDLAQTEYGLMASPEKAAAEIWRDLRDELRLTVDLDGLSKYSLAEFYTVWNQRINRMVAGPQKERHKDLLALCDAGVLKFLHPDVPTQDLAQVSIKARVQSSSLDSTNSLLLRDLLRLGIIRSVPSLPTGPGGLEINHRNNPIGRNGIATLNIWVVGPIVEGSTYYNHYVSSPGSPSRLFMDAHRIASAALDPPSPNTTSSGVDAYQSEPLAAKTQNHQYQ